jgi:hypothetical protein
VILSVRDSPAVFLGTPRFRDRKRMFWATALFNDAVSAVEVIYEAE